MEPRPVAVANVPPVYFRGLCTVLREAGHRPTAPRDVIGWAARTRDATVLVGVDACSDLAYVRHLASSSEDSVVVALLTHAGPRRLAHCLDLGARAAVDMCATPDDIMCTIHGAWTDKTVLPYDTAAFMARWTPVPIDPTDDRVRWLRRLADGVTVDRLAEDIGYSRRAMFRLLAEYYTELGAANRTQALLAAARRGLL